MWILHYQKLQIIDMQKIWVEKHNTVAIKLILCSQFVHEMCVSSENGTKLSS